MELCANEELNSTGIGFVDDVAMLVVSDTIDENNTKLATLYNDGCQTWATTHASRFDPDKFQLVHFLGRRAEFQEKPLVLRRPEGEITILNKRYCKYLGALLDWKLHWDEHINHLEAKVSKKLAVLACLGGSTWGIGVRDLRQVYLLTILPQFQYYCSAWYIPDGGLGFKGREVRALKLMRNVQRRAARIIGGAFRSTSAVALDVELHLPPVEDSMKRAISDALFRLASTPIYRHIAACRKTRVTLDARRAFLTPNSGRLNARYARLSPLQKLEYHHWVVHHTDVRTLETRLPVVTAPWWVGPEYHIAPDADTAWLARELNIDEMTSTLIEHERGINQEQTFYMDTASDVHAAWDRSKFHTYTPADNLTLAGINNQKLRVHGTGSIFLPTIVDGRLREIKITNVFHVPGMYYNLISFSQLEDFGCELHIQHGQFNILDETQEVVFQGERIGDGYVLQLNYKEPPKALRLSTRPQINNASWDQWHKRFGHAGIS